MHRDDLGRVGSPGSGVIQADAQAVRQLRQLVTHGIISNIAAVCGILSRISICICISICINIGINIGIRIVCGILKGTVDNILMVQHIAVVIDYRDIDGYHIRLVPGIGISQSRTPPKHKKQQGSQHHRRATANKLSPRCCKLHKKFPLQ